MPHESRKLPLPPLGKTIMENVILHLESSRISVQPHLVKVKSGFGSGDTSHIEKLVHNVYIFQRSYTHTHIVSATKGESSEDMYALSQIQSHYPTSLYDPSWKPEFPVRSPKSR